MIGFKTSGSLNKTQRWLNKLSRGNLWSKFDYYGELGRSALASATPKDTGLAASSWGYNISRAQNSIAIEWFNTDVENGFPVAILLQYGHGTGTGGYVYGIDYINPAMRPVFYKILSDLIREVSA